MSQNIPGLKPKTGYGEVLIGLQKLLEEYLKLGGDCDLPYPFQVFYSLTFRFTKLHNMRYRQRR